nr:alpha-amylase family glycosyl hydrolase [Xanthomonadales bacterium]
MKRPLLCLLGVIVGLAGCSGDTETDAGIATVSADQARDASACGVDEPLLHVPSPDWRDQILYMMFIDRFNDGDPSNNELGAGEFNARSPAHFNGGDLQGIRDKLDYLQGLGATGVWITPPVLNQWWSTPYAAAGWHGYWAVNFKEMDPHFGTLDDYKALSSDLHCNGMVLIQDIVGNHVGNFYAYEGEWDPNDTAKNFVLLEEGSLQPAPTQYPFNMIDRRNPEHAAADIYHWTPPLNDYNDQNQLYNYAFGFLGDINTENPVVIDALKDSYRFWVEEVGVDGYRIDTVMYVPLKFWHHLLHDPDGVNATARKTGRDHFLNFGEVLVPSEPFKDDGEQRILKYYGTPEMPGLNSMLGFPLYFTIGRVMAQGQPAAQLAFRLEQRMKSYPDPYVIPTFVDNHDTARFLSSGGEAAFRQALTLIFTIPGMPIIYQGTEQGLLETRQAMFESGWMGEPGVFDTQSEYYQLIKGLAAMRTGNRVFTRGTMQVLAGEENGPGVLAYRRDHEDEAALILINTASHGIVVSDLDTGGTSEAWVDWDGVQDCCGVQSDSQGRISLELESRQARVLRRVDQGEAGITDMSETAEAAAVAIAVNPLAADAPFESDFTITGSVPDALGLTELRLLRNGNLDAARSITVGSDGVWSATVPVRNLGDADEYLQVYEPRSGSLSDKIPFSTRIT